MELFIKYMLLLIVVTLVSDGSSQEIGKVYIGALGSSSGLTNATSYTFNLNNGRQQLPIYIRIPDPTNPSIDVALRDTVVISCEASDIRPGYSVVSFLTLTFTPGTTSSQISFDLTASGRTVDIRCYGVSQGLTCPANTSAGAVPPQPQFCQSTSISTPVSMSIRPAPIVSFCSPAIIVPDDGETQSTFSLTLSEPVRAFSVNVYCQVVSPGSLILSIVSPPPVPIGSSDVTVTYDITSRGSPSEVLCVAHSQGGNQYLNSTSSGDSSRARFVVSTGVIQLIPMITPAYSNFFKGVLALDAGAVTDEGISFHCQAVVADDIVQGLALVNTPSCDFTTNITTTPPPTTPSTGTTGTTDSVTTVDVNSTTDPNVTTSSPTSPTTTPVPVDLTSSWILDEGSFSFQKGQTYKLVMARRQRVVLAPATELVVLTCCVMSSTPKYENMSTAMLAANNLQPFFCANCTGGPTSGTITSERVIQNPAFREVAPCPCDLTYSVCDINCCCDQECSDLQKRTFSYCLPGPFGGQGNPTPFRNCYSNHTFKEDWFPLMCVEFETNAYLGMFYGNSPSVQTETAFNVRLAQQPPFYSYREIEQRYVDVSAGVDGYQDGDNIRSQREDIPSSSYPKQGILSLPARSAGGACLDVAPVRFLRDQTSDCVHTDVQSMCRAGSMLSATVYAESTSMSHPACPQSYRIIEKYGTAVTNFTIANTYMSYYCASDDTRYVKSSVSDTVLPTISQTFPQELYTENCSIPCDDPACLQYNMNQETTTPLPPRCPWDDGFTQPPTPFLGSVFCNNTVVDVRYLFTWTGQSIVNLNATVILAPVRMNVAGRPSSLAQDFDVKFQHQMSVTASATDNYDNQTGSFDRSGKPGYDYGKPLMSGCSSGSASVDRTDSRQMAVFQPGPDGLCFSASRRLLTFGDDIGTSCKLRLNIDTINNCTSLRQLLLNHLSLLMPADVIGRQGSNDPSNPNMWVTVLRNIPNLNFTEDDNTTVDTSTVDNSTEIDEDVYQPIDDIRGVCHNLTSGISLVILYGESGQTNAYPIREVVGARVSYTISDWWMSCSGANAVRCQNNSQYVETFTLTSTVTFIKVPASTPPPVIKFYTSKDPSCTTDSCARYYEDFEQSVCHFDTCWSELLYPLSKSYGADPPMYTLAISLVAVLFIIGYFMITRPWF